MAKVIYSKHFPFGKYVAINLFGLIIVKRGTTFTRKSRNHELIHSCQQVEMLWVFFYLWYVVEWLLKLLKHRSFTKAYYNISFEREAYSNESDLLYRRHRKLYAWWRYL